MFTFDLRHIIPHSTSGNPNHLHGSIKNFINLLPGASLVVILAEDYSFLDSESAPILSMLCAPGSSYRYHDDLIRGRPSSVLGVTTRFDRHSVAP